MQLKKLGEKHVDTADIYRDIGEVFLIQNNDKKAEEMYLKALDIKLDILPKNHVEVTDLYDMISAVLQAQGKLSEATKLQRSHLRTDYKCMGKTTLAL